MTLQVKVSDMFWTSYTPELKKRANKIFLLRTYDEKMCKTCDNLPNRHNSQCKECPGFLSESKLWKSNSSNTRIGVPRGNKEKVREWLGTNDFDLIDSRADVPFKTEGMKMTIKMYNYQIPAVKAMCRKRNGQFKAPPRSGKTIMGTAAALKMGQRTLILASQVEYLKQFYETIMGGPSNEPMTNIPELEEITGKKICGICKTEKQMEGLDIVLMTYQSLISDKGRKLLNRIKKKFGTVLVDEVQDCAAPHFSKVINAFYARSRIGMSGTLDRKDGLEILTEDILGPCFYEVKVASAVPRVRIVDSPASKKYVYKLWTYALKYLAEHEGRNEIIANLACKLVRQNRSVVIPVVTIAHVKTLVSMINEKAGKCVAKPFTGQHSPVYRDKLRRDARSGRVKVVVGIRRMVQTGINIPIWSDLIEVIPASNTPKMTQETARIRTIVDGKKTPQVHHVLEHFGPSVGCFRSTYYKVYKAQGFIIDEKEEKKALSYINNRPAKPDYIEAETDGDYVKTDGLFGRSTPVRKYDVSKSGKKVTQMPKNNYTYNIV